VQNPKVGFSVWVKIALILLPMLWIFGNLLGLKQQVEVTKVVFERQGIKFTIRESSPYAPIKDRQDRHFPAIEKLNFNN
jgi:hypothetical protein